MFAAEDEERGAEARRGPGFRSAVARAHYLAAYAESLRAWPVAHATRMVPTRFGDTHVIDCGPADAPPVALLHGAAVSSTSWAANVAPLAARFRVLAVDRVGDVGRSVVRRLPADADGYAIWLSDVLDALGVGRAHVVGLSYGGLLALNLAVRAPHRVDRLVAVDPGSLVPLRKRWLFKAIASMVAPNRQRFDKLMTGFMPGLPLTAPWVEQAWIGALAWKPYKVFLHVLSDAELARITAPTLVMFGEREQVFDGRAAGRRAKDRIINSHVVVFRGVGHAPPFECAEASNERVLAFLS